MDHHQYVCGLSGFLLLPRALVPGLDPIDVHLTRSGPGPGEGLDSLVCRSVSKTNSFRKHNLLFDGRQAISFLWEWSTHRLRCRMTVLLWFWRHRTWANGRVAWTAVALPIGCALPSLSASWNKDTYQSFMCISFSCGHLLTKAGAKGWTKWNSEAGRSVQKRVPKHPTHEVSCDPKRPLGARVSECLPIGGPVAILPPISILKR